MNELAETQAEAARLRRELEKYQTVAQSEQTTVLDGWMKRATSAEARAVELERERSKWEQIAVDLKETKEKYQAQVVRLREIISAVAETLETEAQKLDSFVATQETKSEKALRQGSLTRARSESTSAMPLMPILLRREAKRLVVGISNTPAALPDEGQQPT